MEKPRSLREILKQFCKHLIFGVQTALTINVKKMYPRFPSGT